MTSGIAQALPLLDAWATYSALQQHIPSVALTVVHGDQPVWTKAFGYADVGAKTAATPQTLYRIGSITKTFTALAILQLHEAGKLRLDDRVRDHVTTTAIGARNLGVLDVTIRELLTHSSGLQRELPGTWWSEPSFPAQIPDHFSATYPSGTEWKYSNVGYALLGEVIAAAGGEPWARYLERRILGPLGMANTQAMPHRDEARLATGYSRPAPGELHRPQWLLDDWQTAWGLGMRVRRVDGRVRVGHPGTTPGFAAMVEFVPALKLGVAVLTNADDGNPASYCDYALQLLKPVVARARARAAPALAEDAERYCGLYRSENRHMTMFVAALDGQLALVAPGAPNPYAARVILERTPESHTFIMRRSSAFATLAFGERLRFTTGAGGEVAGYVVSGARFVREPAVAPLDILQPRALPQALYSGIERRKLYIGVDRRKQLQAPYRGVERRADGSDRRGQHRHVVH